MQISSIPVFVRMLFLALLLAMGVLTPLLGARHDPDSRSDGDNPPAAETVQDSLEPNDTPTDASQLAWGIDGDFNLAMSGLAQISGGLDLDFYSIELAAGDSLRASVALPENVSPQLDPSISIMDSAGTVLSSNLATPGVASASASYSGTFLILVSDRSLLQGTPFTGDPRGYELILSRLLRRGDTDGSGELDYRDAFIVFMLASGLLDPQTVEPRVLEAADIDGDGSVVGDMQDFHALMARIGSVPVRAPQSGGKSKSASGGTLLALADGSAVEVEADGALRVIRQGELAAAALASWTARSSRTILPEASVADLEVNYPNPFNPSTTISFSLEEQQTVRLAVHDIRGRLVRVLAERRFLSGRHSVQWDGRDSSGRPVSSGIYFYSLQAGDYVARRKMVLLK